MAGEKTFRDLYRAKAILEADVSAAVDAYMADPTTNHFAICDMYTADLAIAVAAPWFVREAMANENATDELKRAAVRTAILLSRPVKG